MLEELGVAAIIAVATAAIISLKFAKAGIRRFERSSCSDGRLEKLEERIRALEAAGADQEMETDRRIHNLEARMDFTEKLLQEPRGRAELPASD